MRALTAPLPAGFRLEFDSRTAEVAPGVLVGGKPLRVLRVNDRGRTVLAGLRSEPVNTAAGAALARRLVDAGLAHPIPPPHASRPELTVIVPVHGRADELDRCLAALGGAFPVVVVDDASPGRAQIAAVAARHRAEVVRLARNGGPANARNVGLNRVRTPLVAFVDSDTTPSTDDLTTLAAHLLDPLVAAVAPRVRPRAEQSWSGRYTSARCTLDLGARRGSVRPYSAVSYVPSAVLVARRSALADVAAVGKVFDPALRYGEDVDLIWRLLERGWRVRYEPGVGVDHQEPDTWAALLERRFRYGTSAAALARRHPDNAAPLVVNPPFTAAVVAALCGRPASALASAAASVLWTHHLTRRASLPRRRILYATLDGLWQTFLGLGRCSIQFAGPVVIGAAVRRRPAAIALLLAPPLAAWRTGDRRLDPLRYVSGSVADDIAYGAGVLAGCWSQRTLRPLVPRTTRARTPRSGAGSSPDPR